MWCLIYRSEILNLYLTFIFFFLNLNVFSVLYSKPIWISLIIRILSEQILCTTTIFFFQRVWTIFPQNATSTETWPLETFWWRVRWGWKSVISGWPKCCRRTKNTTPLESLGKAPSFGEDDKLHVFTSVRWHSCMFFVVNVLWRIFKQRC